MVKVFDVANWFLSHGEITHKKLQKLCYYAQAWHCALYNGRVLFAERIEAWVHGPVIPELYKEYAFYGWDTIPQYNGDMNFSEEEISILEAVFNTYWRFTGDQLEELTHRESPWIDARRGLERWESSTNEITTESMKEYYFAKYVEAQND